MWLFLKVFRCETHARYGVGTCGGVLSCWTVSFAIAPRPLCPHNSLVGGTSVEQMLGQHQLDNANTYLGVRELLKGDESREEEELDLIPTHL